MAFHRVVHGLIFCAPLALSVAACNGDDDGSGTGSGSGTGTTASSSADGSTSADTTAGSASGTGGVVGDCDSEGWETISMPWSQLAYEDSPEGGFSICVPEPWMVTSDASNIIQLRRGDDTATVLTLGGELRLDHAGAVERVGQQDTGRCQSEDYAAEFLAIDGWPALQHRFTFEAPACGECPDPTDEQLFAVSTYVATGQLLVQLVGQTAAPPSADVVDEMIAIGRTMEATGVGMADGQTTAQELAALEGAHEQICPP